jgi:hypothetical protein
MYVSTEEVAEMMASFTVVALEMVETYKTFIEIIGSRYGKNKAKRRGRFPFEIHTKFAGNASHLFHIQLEYYHPF